MLSLSKHEEMLAQRRGVSGDGNVDLRPFNGACQFFERARLQCEA